MKRLEGELFDKYRIRRSSENQRIKNYLLGRVVWNSGIKGTYIRKKHGELK